ncbi:MAG: hypothetical protein LBM98_03715 [Oscillospiraceae bacterium]|nr:hypothetical protein [Oscillospiraceae bacterium]
MLQVRSNPVPGGQHTDYVSQGSTSTLDCFAAYHWYVSQVRWRLRKDGAPEGAPRAGQCPALSRRIAPGRWTGDASAHGAGNHPGASRHPSQEGNLRGTTPAACGRHPLLRKGAFLVGRGLREARPAPSAAQPSPNPLPPSVKRVPPQRRGLYPRRARRTKFPSWEGCRPQAAEWFPRRSAPEGGFETRPYVPPAGRNPRPNHRL